MGDGDLYPRVYFFYKITLIFLFPYLGKALHRGMLRINHLQLVALKFRVQDESPAEHLLKPLPLPLGAYYGIEAYKASPRLDILPKGQALGICVKHIIVGARE